MTLPQSDTENPQSSKLNIQGEPLPIEDLLLFANVDATDAESAIAWWDDNASAEWVGALDSEPIKGDKKWAKKNST